MKNSLGVLRRAQDQRKRSEVTEKIPLMLKLSKHEALFFNRLLVVFVLALAFTFTAPALAADKLRIGYGAPSLAMSVLWITKEGKLFEKNGLDVEVLYLERAPWYSAR
jgi:hypothetical protein